MHVLKAVRTASAIADCSFDCLRRSEEGCRDSEVPVRFPEEVDHPAQQPFRGGPQVSA